MLTRFSRFSRFIRGVFDGAASSSPSRVRSQWLIDAYTVITVKPVKLRCFCGWLYSLVNVQAGGAEARPYDFASAGN